ncbi:MAG: hypothetical protein IPN76_31230 [Saprospiraceae bacterium]|jgi:hypothetical protein|nr:hypothetical protein [Saprospiraceae bacterium]
MVDYTRDEFLKLLEGNFCKVEGDHRYYLSDPNLDNKDVAESLDLDASYFGTLLNPSSDNVSYKTAIRRLLKYEKTKNLEKQVGELEAENKMLEASQGRRKFVLYSAVGIALIAMILTMWNFYWLPTKLNDTLADYVKSQPQRYVVRDAPTLEKIMQWHGKIVAQQLALEAVLINARIKEKEAELTPEQKMQYIEEARGIVKKVIKDERLGLHSLGFVNEEGKNIYDFLQDAAPYDSLFLDSDPLFPNAFKQAIPYLTSRQEPYSMVAKQMIDVVTVVQGKTWSEMENRMFPSSQ